MIEPVQSGAFSLLMVTTEVDIVGGPSRGTLYSLDQACKECGTGAVRTGKLRLAGSELPSPGTSLFATLDGEVLVNAAVADALHLAGVNCLQGVLDSKSGVALPFLELVPQGILPAFGGATTGYLRERPCKSCRRDGYFHTAKAPLMLSYGTIDASLRNLDLLATFEAFGNSRLRPELRDCHFAQPLLVASSMLTSILAAARVRGLELVPIHIGNE